MSSLLWRSFFLQTAWNPAGFQNLGFAWAIWPALRRIYSSPEQRRQAILRHMDFFQAHPYTAPALLSMTAELEKRGQGERAAGLKRLLSGPLSAIGDELFWAGARPLLGILAAPAVWLFPGKAAVWIAAAYLLLYNAIHLTARIHFWKRGKRLEDPLRLDPLQLRIRRLLRWMGALGRLSALFLPAVAAVLGIAMFHPTLQAALWGGVDRIIFIPTETRRFVGLLYVGCFVFGAWAARRLPEPLAAAVAAAAGIGWGVLLGAGGVS